MDGIIRILQLDQRLGLILFIEGRSGDGSGVGRWLYGREIEEIACLFFGFNFFRWLDDGDKFAPTLIILITIGLLLLNNKKIRFLGTFLIQHRRRLNNSILIMYQSFPKFTPGAFHTHEGSAIFLLTLLLLLGT